MPDAGRTAVIAALIGAATFAAYVANGREIGAGDSIPAIVLPIAITRGDGVALDRWEGAWGGPAARPYFVTVVGGRVLSSYPLGTPLLTLPFVAPQMPWVDYAHPGWDADPQRAFATARLVSKRATAAVTALSAVCLYLAFHAAGLSPIAAVLGALVTALGSNVWMSGAQSPWQHTSSIFFLSAALALLAREPAGRLRLLLAGGACAGLVWSRPSSAIFAIAIAVGVLWRYRRDAVWFAPLPIVLGAALVGFNVATFGRPLGAYGKLLAIGQESHGVDGFLVLDLWTPIGTLLSPSRGLLTMTPWIAVALAVLPWTLPFLRRRVVLAAATIALVPFAILNFCTGPWWAGWSFGPRYWADGLPLFGVLLGFALDWSHRHARPVFATLLATGAVAIAIQTIGAWCYPSSFNSSPGSIDHQHDRLWSWSDGEIARCLREGLRPPEGY